MATKLIDLIEDVTQDDLPTNIFTIEDEDPMVILGKLNEVIAWLKELDIDNVEDILELIAGKVAKTSLPNMVYATDNNGNQITIQMGTSAKQIPRYDAGARLKTNTPSVNEDVANKKYVDDADALKQDALTETQLDAVNSGIDSIKVAQIATNTSNILNKIDKTSLYNRIYGTDAYGQQMLKQIKSLNSISDLGWEFGENHNKIPDISTLAFWDGAYQSDKSSNLKYCAGGEIALKSSVTPTAWQYATANTDAVQQGTCEFCKVGKIVHVYIDNLVVKSGVSGTGSGLVNLFTGLPTTNHTIIFIIPDQVTNSSNAIRAKLDGGTISLHWTDTASFGNTGVHHNLIFSYVEA